MGRHRHGDLIGDKRDRVVNQVLVEGVTILGSSRLVHAVVVMH